jgi:hypothetical protein
MLAIFTLAFATAAILYFEKSTRTGPVARLRERAMQPKKFDPEVADKMTDGGAIVCGLTIIVTLMAVLQNFIDMAA